MKRSTDDSACTIRDAVRDIDDALSRIQRRGRHDTPDVAEAAVMRAVADTLRPMGAAAASGLASDLREFAQSLRRDRLA